MGATVVFTCLAFISVCKQTTKRTYRGAHVSLTYYITYYSILIIIVIIGNIHIRYVHAAMHCNAIHTNQYAY